MSKGRKNNHYHYAEKFEPKSRYMRRKSAVYAPRKAVLLSLLVLIVIGLISTTFAASFDVGSSNNEEIKTNALVASARTAKTNRDLAGSGANVRLAGTGGYNWNADVFFRAPDGWNLSTYPNVQVWAVQSSSASSGTKYANLLGSMDIVGTTTNSRLYHKKIIADHGSWGTEYIAFTANTSNWGTGDFYISTCGQYTQPLSYGATNSSGAYLFTPSDAANNTAANNNSITGSYNGTGRTVLMKNQDFYVYTNGTASAAGGTMTVSAHYENGSNYSGGDAIANNEITIDSGDTGAHELYSAVEGTKVTLSNTPSSGYVFDGYYNAATGGNAVTSPYYVFGARSVYARFKNATYSITYKDQGDAAFSGTHASGYPTTHTYNNATTLKTASKVGYNFGGWYTNSACTGSAVTSLGATDYTSNITLYAKWTIKTYTLTFSETGGSGTFEVDNNAFTSGGAVSHGSHSITISAPTNYQVTGVSINSTPYVITAAPSVTLSGVSITAPTTISVTYEPIAVCGFTLDLHSATLNVGETATFTAEPNAHHDSSGVISAASSSNSVATVDKDGDTYTVTAKGPGTATITVSCNEAGSIPATFSVTVNTPGFTAANISNVAVNQTVTPASYFSYSNPAEQRGTFTYTSSNANIQINNDGTITALSPGTATVTAQYHYSHEGESYTIPATQSFTISVNTPQISVNNPTMEETLSETLTTTVVSGPNPASFSWEILSNTVNDPISLSTGSGSTTTVSSVKLDSSASDKTYTVRLTARYNDSYSLTANSTVTVTRSPYYVLGFDDNDDGNQDNWSWKTAGNARRMTIVSGTSSTYQSGEISLDVEEDEPHDGDNGFKICVVDYSNADDNSNATWYGYNTGITESAHENVTFYNNQNNCSLYVSRKGEYTFTFNSSNNQVTVNYPVSKTVTFVDSLKNTSTNVLVTANKTMTQSGVHAPTNPSVAGYTFNGWRDSSSGTLYATQAAVEAVTYTDNVTYNAEYTLNAPTVTLTAGSSNYTVGNSAVNLTGSYTTAAAGVTPVCTFSVIGAVTSTGGGTPDGVSGASVTKTSNTAGSFSATIPARYTVQYSVTISDGTRSASSATTQNIEVRPAAPEFDLTITYNGVTGGNGTQANPFVATLGSDIKYDVNVTSTPAGEGTYFYSWLKQYSNQSSYTQLNPSDFLEGSNNNYSHVIFDLIHAKSVTSGSFGLSIAGSVSYNGFSSSSYKTKAVYYRIDSWITSFELNPFQRIYHPNSVSTLNFSPTYHNQLATTAGTAGKYFETALLFSNLDSNIEHTDNWNEIQSATGSDSALTQFSDSSLEYLRTAGVKYFYLSTREYTTRDPADDLDYEVHSASVHTTVGADSSAAEKPFYYSDSIFTLSSYRVTAYWVDENQTMKFQHMQPVGSTGMYRAYLPADLSEVVIAASDKNYYAVPKLENGVFVFNDNYFDYFTRTPISLNTSGRAFVDGYNLFTVSSIGEDQSETGQIFYYNITGTLTKRYTPSGD